MSRATVIAIATRFADALLAHATTWELVKHAPLDAQADLMLQLHKQALDAETAQHELRVWAQLEAQRKVGK